MADNPNGDSPENVPEPRQRRRRDFESANGDEVAREAAAPENGAAHGADQAKEEQPDAFRRRRTATDANTGASPIEAAAVAPTSAASPGAAAKPSGTGRQAMTNPDAKLPGPATASAPRSAASVTEPAKEAEGEQAAGKENAAPKKPAGDGVSSGRRVMRIVLMLLLLFAAVVIVFVVLEEVDRPARYAAAVVVPEFKPLPPDPEGDQLAQTLFDRLKAGGYSVVRGKRDEYLAINPPNAGVLRAVYLADAEYIVRDAYSQLAGMPAAEGDGGQFLAVEERLERIIPRMRVLSRMEEFRADWGKDLLGLPGIQELYDATDDEFFTANRRLNEWRRYLSAFEDAYNDVANSTPPAYEMAVTRLLPLITILPGNGVRNLCDSLGALREARAAVAANDMRTANEALNGMRLREVTAQAVHIEDRMEVLCRRHQEQIAGQFASWRRLWEESERSAALYKAGDVTGAVADIDAVIARTTPDSPASQALYDELVVRSRHWNDVLAAYDRALDQDRNGTIPQRMAAWQSFNSLLDAEHDAWQVAQAKEGAKRIVDELNADLVNFADKTRGDWDSYEEITSRQRQPGTPREEFSGAAEKLRNLSLAAEDALHVNSMAVGVELNAKAKEAVSMARKILAEQGGQAQSLWNLGRLYRDRGEIAMFRECLERILLLGENQSNPFYVEARKILTEDAENAAQNSAG